MGVPALKLIAEARSAGLKLRAEGDRLVIRGPRSAEPIAKALLDKKAEILPFLRERPPTPPAKVSPSKVRPFLPRPLGQEEALDPWDAWIPLFDWLIEHHPDHFFAVCDVEDTLNRMEREGITTGAEYDRACEELRTRFETARQLKLTAKVWIQ